MKTTLSDADLEARVRQTLAAVAATTEHPRARPARRRRLALRLGVGAGAGIVVATVAASAFFGTGDEYVDKLPPDHVIMSGAVGSDQYWLVRSFHHDSCGGRVPGVEMVVESRNNRGQEWNTTGSTYGEADPGNCRVDTTGWLSDPARWDAGGQEVDGTRLVTVTAHPDTTGIRVTISGRTSTHDAYLVDGGRYAVFEVPPDADSYTLSLLHGDDLVPASTRTVPIRR